MRIRLTVTVILVCLTVNLCAQQTDSLIDKVTSFPGRIFDRIRNKSQSLDEQLTSKTEKYLRRLAKKEDKIRQKLSGIDPAAADRLFASSSQKYQELLSGLTAPVNPNIQQPLHEYIPGLDSVQTAMRFISAMPSNTAVGAGGKWQQAALASRQLQQLQTKLQRAGDIQQFIKQRVDQLKTQLVSYGLGRQLTSLNKEAYYYQQQLVEYKTMLHDPDKMERKLLSVLSETPSFQNFMKKYSLLGQLFSMPDDYGSEASMAGLQTKAGVAQMISQHMGSGANNGSSGASNPQQFVQQQMQLAQQQLTQLQHKLGGWATVPAAATIS